jgi:flagellar hook-basal body complex protein FliE
VLSEISVLLPVLPVPLQEGRAAKKAGAFELASSFREVLAQQFKALNESQKQADALAVKYLTGEVQDLHQVILALEQANLSLQLAMQVRNKVIEAYQEISRMQI